MSTLLTFTFWIAVGVVLFRMFRADNAGRTSEAVRYCVLFIFLLILGVFLP